MLQRPYDVDGLFVMGGSLINLGSALPEDAPAMLAAFEPETTKNLQYFSEMPTLDRQKAYLEKMSASHSDVLFTISRSSDQRLLGTIGLHEIDRHIRLARLGMLIFRSADRGHGYGNEATKLTLDFAFNYLGLNKVIINLFETNTRAQEHYLKLGFEVEGLLREEYLLNGEYHNLVRLAMFKRRFLLPAV